MTRFATLLLAAALMTGCATDPQVTLAMLEAHRAAQAQPTITLRCPSGCELAYVDPRDRQQFRAPTNGWDAVIAIGQTTLQVAQTAIAPVALGYVAVRGFDAIKGSGAVVTTTTTNTGPVTTTTAPVTTNTTTSTTAPVTTTVGPNSGAGSGTSTVGANSGAGSGTSTTTNTSTVGANSGANSGDARGDNRGNTSTSTSSSSSTSTNTSTTVGANSGTSSGNNRNNGGGS